MKSSTVIIKVTDRCNLNCSYCSYVSQGGGDLSLDVLEKFIDGLYLYIKKWDINKIKLLFHGGETFLWPIDNYKKTFDIIYRKLPDNTEIDFALQTNGTILSEPYLTLFQQEKVSIGVSLDGTEAIHNKMRPFKNGTGSFGAVCNFLDELKIRNMHFGIVCVVSRKSLDHAEKIYSFLNSCSPNIRFLPVAPIGKGSDLPFKEGEFGNFLIELFKLHLKNISNQKQITKIEPLNTMIGSILKVPLKDKECTFCDACGNFITLNVDGVIYNCGRLVGMNEFVFGDVEGKEWIEKNFSRFSKKRIEKLKNGPCGSCTYFDCCYGGCPATAGDNLKENKTIFCADYKRFFDYLAKEGLELMRPLLLQELKEVRFLLTLLDRIKAW